MYTTSDKLNFYLKQFIEAIFDCYSRNNYFMLKLSYAKSCKKNK